jgi:2-polyprenyl-6-hydroxyphenyl methylase/3-demethylubiquinone-9 3-methyltransferase
MLDCVWSYPLAGSFWESYATRAAELAGKAEPPKIVDIGAGRTTPYAIFLSSSSSELIGVDVLREDLEANRALTQRVVCDVVSDGIPKEAQGAGLITSRMVLEHVRDLDRFAQEVHSALAPGGWTIHMFAGRYSLFAILNRLLPESASRRILFALRPESVEVGGFLTFYDHTHAKAAESVFRRAGMVSVETEVSYEVSQYFRFFFPLFVLTRLWETALHRLMLKNLGSFVLLVARRPEIHE